MGVGYHGKPLVHHLFQRNGVISGKSTHQSGSPFSQLENKGRDQLIFKFLPNQILNDFSRCSLNFQAPSNSSLHSLLAHLMSLCIFHLIFQSRFLFGTFSLALQFFELCIL